jgi:hypothetical protein
LEQPGASFRFPFVYAIGSRLRYYAYGIDIVSIILMLIMWIDDGLHKDKADHIPSLVSPGTVRVSVSFCSRFFHPQPRKKKAHGILLLPRPAYPPSPRVLFFFRAHGSEHGISGANKNPAESKLRSQPSLDVFDVCNPGSNITKGTKEPTKVIIIL